VRIVAQTIIVEMNSCTGDAETRETVDQSYCQEASRFDEFGAGIC
jgi:hypothetical protein